MRRQGERAQRITVSTVLINYASPAFRDYQQINAMTAKQFGFDSCRCFGPEDIDPEFYKSHREILSNPRGAGFWLWKPYLVERCLREMRTGDFLLYSDATIHFVNPIEPMLDTMEKCGLDILILGESFSESQFTKRDAFLLMDADSARISSTPQRFASAVMLRNSPFTLEFCRDWLSFCEDPRILTDAPNCRGKDNYPDFAAHRHDQSVFSVLSKLQRLEVPSLNYLAEGLPDRGSQIINHPRVQLSPREVLVRLLAQNVLRTSNLSALN